MREKLMFVALPDADLSLSTAVPFEHVAKKPLVLPSHQHSLRILIEDIASKDGMNLTVSFEADGLTMLKDLVLRGLGCTV